LYHMIHSRLISTRPVQLRQKVAWTRRPPRHRPCSTAGSVAELSRRKVDHCSECVDAEETRSGRRSAQHRRRDPAGAAGCGARDLALKKRCRGRCRPGHSFESIGCGGPQLPLLAPVRRWACSESSVAARTRKPGAAGLRGSRSQIKRPARNFECPSYRAGAASCEFLEEP
jgi:hypothetical protein